MKTEELTAIGLSEEQATQVLAIHGKDIEKHKKTITTLETEKEGLKGQLSTAEAALQKFEGIDPQQIQQEIQTYKEQAEAAQKHIQAQITARDQRDWLKQKFDTYGVTSPYARKQLEAECMAEGSGLTWKDGAYFGFDDYMKAAKEKDKSLYLTDEEKKAAEEAEKLKNKAPKFTGPNGAPAPKDEKRTPPKIF